MRGKPCPGCGGQTWIGEWQSLCGSCVNEAQKYWDENPVLVELYIGGGVAALEHLLVRHAAFAAWLVAHQGGTT